jgi:hypothetical protein
LGVDDKLKTYERLVATDEPVLLGMGHLFNNRFMKAKKVFESEADTNPLFGFGMGYMAFLKGRSKRYALAD